MAYTLENLQGPWSSLASGSRILVEGQTAFLGCRTDGSEPANTGELLISDGRLLQLRLKSGEERQGELTEDGTMVKWKSGEVWEQWVEHSSDEDEEEEDDNTASNLPTSSPQVAPLSEAQQHLKDGFIIPCSEEKGEQEYGYPKLPEECKDPNFWKKEQHRMTTDPRHNPNLICEDGPEFWDNAMRFPWAKTIVRKEEHWNQRRETWNQQSRKVCDLNIGRRDVCELLEDLPVTIKKLAAPVLKYKVFEGFVVAINDEARELGIPFKELVASPKYIQSLTNASKMLQNGGTDVATNLQDSYDHLMKHALDVEEEKEKEVEKTRVIIDAEGLKVALETGQKFKKDGLLEWAQENYEEALISWKHGDLILKRFRAPFRRVKENDMIITLHGALLKNLAQAAIKLEHWSEALDAADRAVELNAEDHKALFRKACALEGLGRLDEIEQCLSTIEGISVGRTDRERISKDVEIKREKVKALNDRGDQVQQAMLGDALQKGVFGDQRSNGAGTEMSIEPGFQSIDSEPSKTRRPLNLLPKSKASSAVKPKVMRGTKLGEFKLSAGAADTVPIGRKRLTRDAVWDLLADIENAYLDAYVCQKIDKLIGDMHFDPELFLANVGGIALDAQRPMLTKWGFADTAVGMEELKLAIRDHVRTPDADPALKERSERVNRMLYGSPELGMYERTHHGDASA